MNIKEEIEKLALWYIPVTIILALLTTGTSGYLTDLMQGEITFGGKVMLVSYLAQAIGAADNIVVGIWLFIQARKNDGKAMLWFLFGLIANLLAALFYLAILIYEQNSGVSAKEKIANN